MQMLWVDTFGNFGDISQSTAMTYFGPDHCARLDRVYVNLVHVPPDLFKVRSWIMPGFRELSDHVPVCVYIYTPTPQKSARLPTASICHPMFSTKTVEYYEQHETEHTSPWYKLKLLKKSMYQASKWIKKHARPIAEEVEHRLAVAAKFFKASLVGDIRTMRTACENEPRLSSTFLVKNSVPIVLPSFFTFWQELVLRQISDPSHRPSAIASDPKGATRISTVISKAGKIGGAALDAVWDPGLAKPVFTRESRVNSLVSHWKTVFMKKPYCERSCDEILENYRREAPQIDWELSRNHLAFLLKHPKKSAPGPDGVPFSAFTATMELSFPILWGCAADLLQGGSPPPDFNHANLILLPKKPSVEVDGVKWFAPKDTRPLSIVNSDNRILANIFREVLGKFASKFCRKEQRGFLTNRFLLDNVIDVDFEARKLYLQGSDGGLVLVDLAAAFPSLGHDYLFRILEHQGVPDQFITAIRAFYVNNLNFISLDGATSPAFVAQSGVRQGCPMSPVLFALALDPFLDYVSRRLPENTLVRAYADDMAFILHDLSDITSLADAFQVLGKASALHVNIGKTVCVPLFPTTGLCIRTFFSRTPWAGVQVHMGYSKYLGILVGPKATAEANFEHVMEKYRIRANMWLSFKHLGATLQVLGYNMFAASVFNFVCQLYVLPLDLQEEIQIKALQFMHGPRFWLHGNKGHAFFRAGIEVGFPAVPRCIMTAGLQSCYSAYTKHAPDFTAKVHLLQTLGGGNVTLRDIGTITANSPYASFRIVHTCAQQVKLDSKLLACRDVRNVNRTIYDAFHTLRYTIGATTSKLQQVYAHRWCKPHLINDMRIAHLAMSTCKRLIWLSRRVPPRVHIANVRFQFNGFHTSRRYQKHTRCLFCRQPAASDCIEHLVVCQAVQDLFPSHLKKGSPPRIPVANFFLIGHDDTHRIVFALVIYALYTLHNEFRHTSDRHEFRRRIHHIMHDASSSRDWEKVLLGPSESPIGARECPNWSRT